MAELEEDFNEDLLIDFRDVHLIRGGRTLVGPVDWQVELDERWVIMGPNGAGKTSLMRIAAAEEFPSSGVAHVMGEQIGRTDMRDLRTMIGLTSSSIAHRIPNDEKVADLVISASYSVLGRWRETYEEMDFEQLSEILERKRVLIARAMMVNPELLLLDEPGAGLDLGGREDLVGYLGELALDPDAPAMVMIKHHPEEIPYGFTHAMLLDEGNVIAQGLIDDVLTSENLTKAFHQEIVVDRIDDRYFARRARPAGKHRKK